MFSRISSAAFILLTAGCQSGDDAVDSGTADRTRVACAIDGANEFSSDCTLAIAEGVSERVLTVFEPSGSFRRLLITSDGRGVVAADGAEQVTIVPLAKDLIEVSLGDDRYRIPATVKTDGEKP